LTEEEIITLIRSGGRAREAGVRALYDGLAQPMLRFFVVHRLSGDEAKDILQETIIKIVRGCNSYAGQGQAKAWLWQIARNCLTDHLRKQSRLAANEAVFDGESWQTLEETVGDPAAGEPKSSVDECVAAGIAEFGERMPDRAYVLTLQMEGTSIGEIAERIGRTIAATKEYLSQCRKKLSPYVSHCVEFLPT
jgi:RNA polymerase sigma-70 factor (ECF subfamily)